MPNLGRKKNDLAHTSYLRPTGISRNCKPTKTDKKREGDMNNYPACAEH